MRSNLTLWWGWKVLDVLLVPFMGLLNKCRWERPQETHPWHYVAWLGNPNSVLAVQISGLQIADSSDLVAWWDPRIHMPFLGSVWEHYIVLQPTDYADDWHLGYYTLNGQPVVHRLALKRGESVRTLVFKGAITFFATDKFGAQIALKKIGEGRLGDQKFASVRQF